MKGGDSREVVVADTESGERGKSSKQMRVEVGEMVVVQLDCPQMTQPREHIWRQFSQ